MELGAWKDILFPQPGFSMSSMGKMPGQHQALEKQLLAMEQESLQTSPLLSVPGVPSPACQSLGASDLGYVVVGEQALLAS